MLLRVRQQLFSFLQSSLKDLYPQDIEMPSVEVERPADKTHGDFSANIAMKSAKLLKKKPVDIAGDMVEKLKAALPHSDLADTIGEIEIKGPGFINFFFSDAFYRKVPQNIFSEGDNFGRNDLGGGVKILLEFVSANPTGPLTIAHARQAAVGDALANVLNYCGCKVEKEYYVNDGGNQIRILGQSIKRRLLQSKDKDVEFPEDCYQGEYIKDIAAEAEAQVGKIPEGSVSEEWVNDWKQEEFEHLGKEYLLKVIEDDLKRFGVTFDTWSRESVVASKEKIEQLLSEFDAKGISKEEDGALWFKTTDFGDDKDRVLRKSDGSYTYLTPDIVYHKNKFDRGFDKVYDILGPDHHGYIKRLKAAAQALGKSADDLEVLIVQLASIFRNGQAVSMSTRKGEFISLREVMDEVGVDAARFFFLMRQMKQHLDFDLDLAKKAAPENPVYYVQYAHARVFSINTKAEEAGITMSTDRFDLLDQEEELDLIKALGAFEISLSYCYNQTDPYPLINYLQETAGVFHRFYDRHKVVCEDKELSAQRLGLVNAARIVIANGLKLIGVSAPEKM